jgi:hypothetical protein
VFDQRVIDVDSIRQNHVSNGALVLVMAVGLDRNVFPKGEGRVGVLGVVAVGLALLGSVVAAEMGAYTDEGQGKSIRAIAEAVTVSNSFLHKTCVNCGPQTHENSACQI